MKFIIAWKIKIITCFLFICFSFVLVSGLHKEIKFHCNSGESFEVLKFHGVILHEKEISLVLKKYLSSLGILDIKSNKKILIPCDNDKFIFIENLHSKESSLYFDMKSISMNFQQFDKNEATKRLRELYDDLLGL